MAKIRRTRKLAFSSCPSPFPLLWVFPFWVASRLREIDLILRSDDLILYPPPFPLGRSSHLPDSDPHDVLYEGILEGLRTFLPLSSFSVAFHFLHFRFFSFR